MKSTTEQIKKINAKEAKIAKPGMPSRNTPTNAGKASGSIPKESVKSTVDKVLNRIKK